MKAMLIYVSLMTRVVVPDDATEEEILNAATPRLIDKIETELGENIASIEEDAECPYDKDDDYDSFEINQQDGSKER